MPERTAKEAVAIIINGTKGWDKQRITVDKFNDTIYYVKIFGYPTIKVEIEGDDATVFLREENDWYKNMRPGEVSSLYFL